MNMEERYLKFEELMADLAAYLVSEYDIEPRDAAGLVMNSPLVQELYSSEEPITEQRVKALAKEIMPKDWGAPCNNEENAEVYSIFVYFCGREE